MMNGKNVRTLATMAALMTSALIGMTAEARAQDRSLWLGTGQTSNVEGYFASGETIYGSCDGDCYDLDIFLYDAYGTLVSQDTAVDANPVVRAPYEGTFVVQVSMPNCSHQQGCAAWVSSDYGF